MTIVDQGKIVCPYCYQIGTVHVSLAKIKQGISGGKVVAAIFTSGLSLLFTGLSRKVLVNAMACSYCGMRWFA